MIIKLKGADFAANNIGKITMPIKLNDYTKRAVASCGKDLTQEQQLALNDLFLAMGVDGSNDAMSVTRKLYIPMIAGDISKAMINYAEPNMTNDKTDLDSNVWTLRNNGLVAIGDGQPINLTLNNILTADNYSCFNLRTEPMITGKSSYKLVLRGKTNNTLFLGITEQTSSAGDSVFFNGSYGREWRLDADGKLIGVDNSPYDNITTKFVNVKDNVFQLRNCEGITVGTPSPITSDMSGETTQTLYVKGLNTCEKNYAEALLMIGESYDLEVAANIAEKIDALYEVMKS